MAQNTARPEPGIATDDELEAATDALRDALGEDIAKTVYAERFEQLWSNDESTEVITVRLTDNRQATKETVVNDALLSDVPVRVRDLELRDSDKLTFYPTNQQG